MVQFSKNISVYLEIGNKRIFAGALDWPGWCRSGRSEEQAIQALFDYGPRYASVLRETPLAFQAPKNLSELIVTERLIGDSTTDFGAPSIAPASDTRPFNEADLRHFETLLNACWQTFDKATEAAGGKPLRLGPRGGGRDLEGIIHHVLGADESYLVRLAWKLKKSKENNLEKDLIQIRQAILNALASAARGESPTRGPRGGILWPPRYFVRRVAWHVLDHTWELEDRIMT